MCSEMLNLVQHFRTGKVFFKKTGKVLETNVVLLYINGTCRDGGIGRHKGLKIPRWSNGVPVRVWFPAKKAERKFCFFCKKKPKVRLKWRLTAHSKSLRLSCKFLKLHLNRCLLIYRQQGFP
mgnify:CR=1 FL=1